MDERIFLQNYWQYKIKIVLLYYTSNTMKEREVILDYIFDNERPIYIQLVEILRKEMVSGKLKPGERLPSVRELALTARVNPNTMQKALVELENEGLVYTERTNGKYVTNDYDIIENKKNELAEQKVTRYLNDMESIGINHDEAIKYLEREYKNDWIYWCV